MHIKSLSLGPLGTNCYIIYNDTEALVIDPGGDAEQVIHFLTETKVKPLAILLTHAHFDHIGGVEELRNHYNVNVYVHQMEADWLDNPHLNGSTLFMGGEIVTSKAEKHFEHGPLQFNNFSFEVIHTPGHSPGSVSFVFQDQKFAVSGDVLFYGGIGRTDLPGGDIKQLEQSIKHSLYSLPETFKIYPGHGPETTIGQEKRQNPFFPSN
ncbi:MBL fold metallo-hydrolase [Virgibacillus siamensis]|uniref:MBL fold metallo-hydrolase n=1 Tax=Virgibacillus siamensis TaxID=480071 RepID=UPI000984FA0E|nr:MBL fold metallo-hydrolase [Virgibacillus siamensis]